MELKNLMEELVWRQLDQVLKIRKSTVTEQQRYRIAAKALNALPSFYTALEEGQPYFLSESLGKQFQIDIITALSNAVCEVEKEDGKSC